MYQQLRYAFHEHHHTRVANRPGLFFKRVIHLIKEIKRKQSFQVGQHVAIGCAPLSVLDAHLVTA